ncbi:copper resistance D family protein [Marinicellulosiphila megalodicopiae]|uniref:copper resistance D family protein n=1 Tax=Marinicellulosiphila megalodicopiae TaxID=2724896 RepID=UPI003BAFA34B
MFEMIQLLSQIMINLLSITLIGLFICQTIIMPKALNPIIILKLKSWKIAQIILLGIFLIINYITLVIVFAEEGFSGLMDPFYHELILDGPQKWILALSVLSLLLLSITHLIAIKSYFKSIINLIFSSLLLSPFIFSGHFYDAHIVFTVLILIHIICVSFWIGSLYPLYLCSLPTLNTDIPSVKSLMDKFGNIAAAFVASLILSGGILLVYNTNDLNTIFTSNYHLGFLVKFLSVAVILIIACLHKFVLVKNLSDRHSLVKLNRSIFIEIIVALIIILISTVVVKYIGLE